MTIFLIMAALFASGYTLLRSASASGDSRDELLRYELKNKDQSGNTMYRSLEHWKAHQAEKSYLQDVYGIKSKLGAFMITIAFVVGLIHFA